MVRIWICGEFVLWMAQCQYANSRFSNLQNKLWYQNYCLTTLQLGLAYWKIFWKGRWSLACMRNYILHCRGEVSLYKLLRCVDYILYSNTNCINTTVHMVWRGHMVHAYLRISQKHALIVIRNVTLNLATFTPMQEWFQMLRSSKPN